MTYVHRELPQVIVLGDGEPLVGPFCQWCGNQHQFHRASDLACPVRRLHPLLPQGDREVCECTPDHQQHMARIRRPWEGLQVRDHQPACPIYKHGYTGSARRKP